LLPAVHAAREAARTNTSRYNIKQLQLAMLNYNDVNGRFPAAGVDAGNSATDGTQLSWRVHILPYLDESAASLYEQFHLDEPWDSEHNRTLIPMMPATFENPNRPADAGAGTTNYLAVTGPGAFFQGEQPGPRFQDIRDGVSQTLLIVEADPDQAVIWTKPADWQFDPQNPTQGLGNLRRGVFLAGMADGSVHRIANAINPQEFADMVTRDGGAPSDTLFEGGLFDDPMPEDGFGLPSE
jgi:hypothetical protein